MKGKLLLLAAIVIAVVISGCASIPVVDNSEAVADVSTIISMTERELELKNLLKEELDSSDSVFMNPEPIYYSPFDCYSIDLDSGIYKIELRSLGNMLGFSKSIMIPLITILDEQGNIINTQIEVYEVRSNSMKYPIHIYTLQSFEITETQTVFIMVNADMSSDDRVVSSGYGIAGAIPFKMTLPINRTPHAKYEFSVE